MLKVLLVSGDKETIRTAAEVLGEFCHDMARAGTAENMQAALSMIHDTQPDILVLDTKLADGNGFELLKLFDPNAMKLIFLSAHLEYAIKAIKWNAVDFLVKPLDPDELVQAVQKAATLIDREEKLQASVLAENIRNMNRKEKIILKTFEHVHIINQEEIIRVEADRNYSTFYITDGRKILVSRSIKDFEDQLNDKGFYRIHKSHIINISKVKYFDKAEGGFVVMNDGISIPVASRKRELLLEFFDSLA
jgi:two-component system LytT family response regulator